MQISPTAEKILAIFFARPGQKFYVNELIRKTGQYPNSIQQALKSLEKQGILASRRIGRLNFYIINQEFELLSEIENIVGGHGKRKNKLIAGVGNSFDNNQKWVKLLNRPTSLGFSEALCFSNMTGLKKLYGVSTPTFWYNDITFGVYYLKKELEDLGKKIVRKIENDPSFAKRDVDLCRKVCLDLIGYSKKLHKVDFSKSNKLDLKKYLMNYYKYYLKVFPFITTPHAIERYFETKIREEVLDEELLEILLSPVALEDPERDSALKISDYVRKNGFDQNYSQLLAKHCDNFCWFPLWSIHDKPLDRNYFDEEIKNIMGKVEDPLKELKNLKKEIMLRRKKLSDTLKKIKASRLLVDQVMLLQDYINLRTFRKNAICQAHYYHLTLLLAIAREVGITEKEIKLLSYKEMMEVLSDKKNFGDIKELIKNRKEGWGILMVNGKTEVVSKPVNVIETMERYQIVAPGITMAKIVKGMPTCLGKVTGRVKIVRKLSELGKVEKGDILVAKMTTPDFMMAIHRAAAIVTDEGGVTCHAAIVSREFNLPCIVATKNATQVLADGDLVEVDANEGVVRVTEAVEAPEDMKVIPGKTIYKGKVRGTARIILSVADFAKIKEGDILITAQTTPEYLSSLYRVKGFVADEDSLTSHAVLYGQALKLPSIMGTSFARNIVKDGDKVELDATNGLIKRL